jgi:hypothetical protein
MPLWHLTVTEGQPHPPSLAASCFGKGPIATIGQGRCKKRVNRVSLASAFPPLATTERTSLEVGRSIDADAAAAGSGSADSRRLVPRLSSTPAARVRLDGKAARRSANDADDSLAR